MYSLDTIRLVPATLGANLGTSGCEASPDRYGAALIRSTRVKPVRCASNRSISLSRPPLLCAEKGASHLWQRRSDRTSGLPPQGDMTVREALLRQSSFLPEPEGVWVPRRDD